MKYLTPYQEWQLSVYGNYIPESLPCDEQELFLHEERRFEQWMNTGAELELEELSL